MLATRQISRSRSSLGRLWPSSAAVVYNNNGICSWSLLSSSSSSSSIHIGIVENRKCPFSTDNRRLNEDGMSSHHVNTGNQRPVGWTMYKNKIPVLVEELDNENDNDHDDDDSGAGHTKDKQSQKKLPHGLVSRHIDDSLLFDENPRTSILMELTDRVGILHDVLRYFWKYDINITRIESRPMKPGLGEDQRFDFFLDFDGDGNDPNVRNLLRALSPLSNKLLILDSKDVYWFPRHISELDLIADRTLDAGVDLESDHPGFNDPEYRARRAKLAESAQNHKWDKEIERVEYTHKETEVWSAVWDKMDGLWQQYACEEYLVRI